MTRKGSVLLTGAVALTVALLLAAPVLLATEGVDWHFNGTAIEACSCPMFCPCYFNTQPASHPEHEGDHYCKFNMAYRINEGHHGDTDLAGVEFWVAGDLGESWEDGETDWAVLTFQTGTTEEQKAGVLTALTHIFPVTWKSFEIAEDADIEWTATEDRAEAKLAGGENAHVILNKWAGPEPGNTVLENISYFGAFRNTGFKMMPNEIETYKVGERAFEYSGTTGFMITVDMTSDDVAP